MVLTSICEKLCAATLKTQVTLKVLHAIFFSASGHCHFNTDKFFLSHVLISGRVIFVKGVEASLQQ